MGRSTRCWVRVEEATRPSFLSTCFVFALVVFDTRYVPSDFQCLPPFFWFSAPIHMPLIPPSSASLSARLLFLWHLLSIHHTLCPSLTRPHLHALPSPPNHRYASPAASFSISSLISCSREGIMCTWNLNKLSEPLEAIALRPADGGVGGALAARPVAPTALASCEGDVGNNNAGACRSIAVNARTHAHAPVTACTCDAAGRPSPLLPPQLRRASAPLLVCAWRGETAANSLLVHVCCSLGWMLSFGLALRSFRRGVRGWKGKAQQQ